MNIILYTEILLAALLLTAYRKVIRMNKKTQQVLYNITNQYNNQPMATFADLQTAAQNNTAAAQALETAVTNYVAAHSTDITAAQADEIVAAMNASTVSLTQAAAILSTPA